MKPQIINTENNNITAIYESPTIKTYTSSELLDMIGPVRAYDGDIQALDNTLGYYAPEEGDRGGLI